jgi:hypothetical protein
MVEDFISTAWLRGVVAQQQRRYFCAATIPYHLTVVFQDQSLQQCPAADAFPTSLHRQPSSAASLLILILILILVALSLIPFIVIIVIIIVVVVVIIIVIIVIAAGCHGRVLPAPQRTRPWGSSGWEVVVATDEAEERPDLLDKAVAMPCNATD